MESDKMDMPTNVKVKNKSAYIYCLTALLFVATVSGAGAYSWRDSQANAQKNNDSINIKSLKTEITKIKSEAVIAAQLNVMSRSYGDIAKIVADAYNSDFGHYPILTTDFKTKDGIIALPEGIGSSVKDPVFNDNGLTTFKWEYSGPANAPTGGRITTWDFAKSKVSDTAIYVGTATAKSIFITPTS